MGELLAMPREWLAATGEIGKFTGQIVGDVYSLRVFRFFGESLRQAGILIVGSTAVIWSLVFLMGLGVCGIGGAYFTLSTGAPAYAGVFSAWCDLREAVPYAFGYMMAANGCGISHTRYAAAMSKTLVIAEKPSVGQDLARMLKGPFKKGEGWLEGPEHVITWAVGHLVQLAEPDEYDPKFKRWKMDDLPIVPERFKLVVRDERSRKQMSVVTKQIGRDDIDEVVNACDAGREGELIFAYLYEKANGKKPVNRLWLKSMTSAAMKEAFGSLRPADDSRGSSRPRARARRPTGSSA